MPSQACGIARTAVSEIADDLSTQGERTENMRRDNVPYNIRKLRRKQFCKLNIISINEVKI